MFNFFRKLYREEVLLIYVLSAFSTVDFLRGLHLLAKFLSSLARRSADSAAKEQLQELPGSDTVQVWRSFLAGVS